MLRTAAALLAAFLAAPAAAQVRPVSQWRAVVSAPAASALSNRVVSAYLREEVPVSRAPDVATFFGRLGSQLTVTERPELSPAIIALAEGLAAQGVTDPKEATAAQLAKASADVEAALAEEIARLTGPFAEGVDADAEASWANSAEEIASFTVRYDTLLEHEQVVKLRNESGRRLLMARQQRARAHAESYAAELAKGKTPEQLFGAEAALTAGGRAADAGRLAPSEPGETARRAAPPRPSASSDPAGPAKSRAVESWAIYLLGVVGLGGLGLLMAGAAAAAGTGGAFAMSLVYLTGFGLAAERLRLRYWQGESGRAAGVFAALAAAMTSISLFTGLLSVDAEFSSLATRALVYLTAPVAAFFYAKRVRSELLAIPAAAGIFAFAIDALMKVMDAVQTGRFEHFAWMISGLGLVSLIGSRASERITASEGKPDYERWFYLGGLGVLATGLSALWGSSAIPGLLFAVAGGALVLGGAAIGRVSFAVLGGGMALVYMAKLALSLASTSLLAAGAMAVAVCAAGIFAVVNVRRFGEFSGWIRELLKMPPVKDGPIPPDEDAGS